MEFFFPREKDGKRTHGFNEDYEIEVEVQSLMQRKNSKTWDGR